MTKRKRVFLWLSRPKKRRFLSYPKTLSFQSPLKSPSPSRKRPPATSSVKKHKRVNVSSSPIEPFVDELKDHGDLFQQQKDEFVQMASDDTVLNTLSNCKLLYYFTLFFKLVKKGQYPLQNISFLLWLETVRWFSNESTQSMWYWETTKNFWRAGYRLFHGKFLSFMSGPKNVGAFVLGKSHPFPINPQESEINFAVPSRALIVDNSVSGIPAVLEPGVITQTIDAVSANSTSNKIHMLCVDGKKVTAGLDANYGDVDMFGHEESPKINEMKERLVNELKIVDDLQTEFSRNDDVNKDLKISGLKSLIRILTVRIKEGRDLKMKQEYGLEKLKERAGPEWKTSKYVFAISGIQAFLYRVKLFIDSTLLNIDKLCKFSCSMTGKAVNFCDKGTVCPSAQTNLFTLKDVDKQTHPVPTWYIQQRTSDWHLIRKMAPVTGSSLHNAIGLRGLKEQRAHFDNHVDGKDLPEVSEKVKEYMDHGTQNEPNAVATLVGKILPIFYPNLCFVEEGCYLLNGTAQSPLLVVSPDGSLRDIWTSGNECLPTTCIAAVEIKCPYPKEKGYSIFYEVPKYYILQCLAEMKALQVGKLIFLCYTVESTTVFEMEFDEGLWKAAMECVEDYYGKENIKRPTRLKPVTKEIKARLDEYASRKIRLIAEVLSVQMNTTTRREDEENESPFLVGTETGNVRTDINTEIQVLLNESQDCLRNGHQLSRKKANEVMVWVLSNKDRFWSPELPNSVPIAYGLKSFRLSSEALRQACNDVLAECTKRNLVVPLLAFDGQWYSLMVRDENGNPLTKLQLQKDVWKESLGTKRQDIIVRLKEVNKVVIKDTIEQCEGFRVEKLASGFHISSTDIGFQTVRTNLSKKHWSKKSKEEKETPGAPTESVDEELGGLTDWIPDNVLKALEESGDQEILSTIQDISRDITNLLTKDKSAEVDTETSDRESNELENTQEQAGNRQLPPASEPENTMNGEEHAEQIQEEQEQIRYELQDEHVRIILDHLKTSSKRDKVSKMTFVDLKNVLLSTSRISTLTKAELHTVITTLRDRFGFAAIAYQKSWNKPKIINALSRAIGDGTVVKEQKKKVKQTKVSTLKDLTIKVLKSKDVPKVVLNIAYAQYIFPKRLKEWQSHSPVGEKCIIEGVHEEIEWYSYPEINQATGKPLCKTLDSHHLLTNLRIKTSTTGIKDIKSDAWKKVAREHCTNLTPAMVDDLVDKQCNAYAQTHFSEDVELEMLKNGDVKEAEFCRLIRQWYEAEDQPALTASERISRWLKLKQYMLKDVRFCEFPPNMQFIKGMSVISFEGFLTGIDTKIQLYRLCGSYCVRTASSLPAETCVGGIQDMNLNNTMSVKAKDIPRIMSSLTEVMTYKCNPERGFYMKTSRSSVYQVQEGDTTTNDTISSVIRPLDHCFDQQNRRRNKARRKLGMITSDLDAPPKGTRPMRQEFHKCDESKILACKKVGFLSNF